MYAYDSFDLKSQERVYDQDEEVYDLSVLTIEQLNEYYSNIAQKINARKKFRYNLQDESPEIKKKCIAS